MTWTAKSVTEYVRQGCLCIFFEYNRLGKAVNSLRERKTEQTMRLCLCQSFLVFWKEPMWETEVLTGAETQ